MDKPYFTIHDDVIRCGTIGITPRYFVSKAAPSPMTKASTFPLFCDGVATFTIKQIVEEYGNFSIKGQGNTLKIAGGNSNGSRKVTVQSSNDDQFDTPFYFNVEHPRLVELMDSLGFRVKSVSRLFIDVDRKSLAMHTQDVLIVFEELSTEKPKQVKTLKRTKIAKLADDLVTKMPGFLTRKINLNLEE
jgi:hypothetical protein